ncbi:MAG: STAS/SEC14 domain-containing protein [Deltaproteobacteria bacterium]|nr:STAS/SEC14 domain-containing protein [Deltaproteobacteria bacterium]
MLAPESRLYFSDTVAELSIVMWSQRGDITDAAFLAYLDAHAADVRGVTQVAILNFSYTFVPTAKGRAAMKAREAELGLSNIKAVALVSSSFLVRGAVQALSWAMPGPKTKAYSPGNHGEALAWLSRFAKFDLLKAHECIGRGAAHVGLDLDSIKTGQNAAG